MKRLVTISFIVFLSIMCLVVFISRENDGAQAHSASQQDVQLAKSEANLIAEDIVVRKKGDMNFRVRVKNIGTSAARNMKGNLQVVLSVKNKQSGEWVVLKNWENIDKIMPGETVSRDFFATSSEDPNLKEDSFILKADISFKTRKGINISKESVAKSFPDDAIVNP